MTTYATWYTPNLYFIIILKNYISKKASMKKYSVSNCYIHSNVQGKRGRVLKIHTQRHTHNIYIYITKFLPLGVIFKHILKMFIWIIYSSKNIILKV